MTCIKHDNRLTCVIMPYHMCFLWSTGVAPSQQPNQHPPQMPARRTKHSMTATHRLPTKEPCSTDTPNETNITAQINCLQHFIGRNI